MWHHVIPREQELSNLLHDKDYIKAIAMAINLDQSMRVYKILTGYLYRYIANNYCLIWISDMLDTDGVEG